MSYGFQANFCFVGRMYLCVLIVQSDLVGYSFDYYDHYVIIIRVFVKYFIPITTYY